MEKPTDAGDFWEDFDRKIEPLRVFLGEIDDENAPFKTASGDNWEGHLAGWVPVQGYGTIDGRPWYFRARYNGWSLSIAENPDDSAVNVRWNKVSGWYYEDDYGEELFEAGWMPYKVAWGFIKDCFEKYKNNEGYFTPSADGSSTL